MAIAPSISFIPRTRLTSMIHRMNTVNVNHIAPTATKATMPMIPDMPSTFSRVMSHRTSESCACASDNAHKRRYEAVCEMHPRQNSMV